MEHPNFSPNNSPAPTPTEAPETRRDGVTDAPAVSDPDATASRHLYTMTVDDVLAELFAYELQRDTRTVQRWCKRGKLRAIIDYENGDRYLIDPASVRDAIAALLQEREQQQPRQESVARPRHDSAGARMRQHDIDPRQYQFTPHSLRDEEPDNTTDAAPSDAASETRRDEVAALEQRVAELEKEKAMLAVDKEVREQMVEYLKGNFQQMLDQALERTEQLGKLQAENTHLRAMLPEGRPEQGRADSPPWPQTGHSPTHEQNVTENMTPPSMHRRAPWSPD